MSKKVIATNVDIRGTVRTGKYIRGGECIFPFYYKNKLYNDCIEGTDGRGSVCPTSLKPTGQKYIKGVPKSPWGSVGHCPKTSSYSEGKKIPLKKYSRKITKKTTQITSQSSPKSKQVRKSRKSKQSVREPKNKMFTDLNKIINTVTKSQYYNGTHGWNNSLLKRHLHLAQKIRDEVSAEAKILCQKKSRNNRIFNLWSSIKKSPQKYVPPPYSSSSSGSSPREQSRRSESSSKSSLKSKKLLLGHTKPPTYLSPKTSEIPSYTSSSSSRVSSKIPETRASDAPDVSSVSSVSTPKSDW